MRQDRAGPRLPPPRASRRLPAARPGGSSRTATARAGRPGPGRRRPATVAASAAACSAGRSDRSVVTGVGVDVGKDETDDVVRVRVGQPIPAGGRHQVVGWRTHPGEMVRVLLPVGQRPEGPDLEPHRWWWRGGTGRRGHDGDRRSGSRRVAAAVGGRHLPVRRARREIARRSGVEGVRMPDAGPPEGGVYEWYQRGVQLLAEGHPAAAATLLARASGVEPGSRSILEALGRAQYDAGRYTESMTSLHRADRGQPHRRLRPLRPRAGREPRRRAPGSPPNTWPWPWRCDPTSATTPVRCAGSGPGRRRVPRDRRPCPWPPAASRPPSAAVRRGPARPRRRGLRGPRRGAGRARGPGVRPRRRHGPRVRDEQRRSDARRRGPRTSPSSGVPAEPPTSSPAPRPPRPSWRSCSAPAPACCPSAARASRRPSGRPGSPSSSEPRTGLPRSSRATAARSGGPSSPRPSSPSARVPGTSPPTPTRRSPRPAGRCPGTGRWSAW